MDTLVLCQTIKQIIVLLVIAALLAGFFPVMAPVIFAIYFAAMAIYCNGNFEGYLKVILTVVFSLNAFVILF